MKIYLKEGTKAKVGEPIISIEVSSQSPVVNSREAKEKNEERRTKNEGKILKPTTNNQSPTTSNYQFKIPILGENISSAQITKVLVNVGDKVEADQIVLEIETDKATVEVPTEVGGTVKEVRVKEGDKVAVDSVAFVIEMSELRIANGELKISEENKSPITNHQPPSSNIKQPFQKIEHTHAPSIVTLPKDFVQVVVPAYYRLEDLRAKSVWIFIKFVEVESAEEFLLKMLKHLQKAMNEQLRTGGLIQLMLVLQEKHFLIFQNGEK